jgi:hypothetical protein
MTSTTQVAEILLNALERKKDESGHFTHVDLLCSNCGREAEIDRIYRPDRVDAAKGLIEHALFEHVSSADVLVQITSRLLTGYEMRLAIGVPAATEHEVKWRESQPS